MVGAVRGGAKPQGVIAACAAIMLAACGAELRAEGEQCFASSECAAGLVCDLAAEPPVCGRGAGAMTPAPDAAPVAGVDAAPAAPDAGPRPDAAADPDPPDAAPTDAAPPDAAPPDASPPDAAI